MMNDIELAISGKPGIYGSESIGINDDSLKTRLYNQCQRDSDVESRLSIYFERIGDDSCALYHYLKPHNVAQKRTKEDEENNRKHGRAGSYFALTIRLKNSYCKDLKFMYSLLEEMFKKHIMNNVLSKNTDNYWEYKVNVLSEAKHILDEIAQEVRREFSKNQELLINLTPSQVEQPSGEIKTLNLDEIEEKKHLDYLRSGGELYISPDYIKKPPQVRSDKKISPEQNGNNGVSGNDETQINNVLEKGSEITTTPSNISFQEIKESREDNTDESISDDTSSNNGKFIDFDKLDKKKIIKYSVALIVLVIIGSFFIKLLSPSKGVDVSDEDTTHTTAIMQQEVIAKDVSDDLPGDRTLEQSEFFRVTRIDITGTSYFVKENCYKLTAMVKNGQKEQRALGAGVFETDSDNLWIHQDSSICIIYVPKSFNKDTIHVSYHYIIEGKDAVCFRSVPVKKTN